MIPRPCLKCGRLGFDSYCPGCKPDHSPQRLRGRRWMRKRAAVFRRSGAICENCHERIAVEVHHLEDLDDNRVSSLLAVCKRCHRALEAAKSSGSPVV